jgi:DMSO reductase iron-sulfur subunit
MFKIRNDEPEYAFLKDQDSERRNRYGKPIELTREGDELRGKSLVINGDGGIGANPNRYKQHGFHFTADNCIACHACEAACSEKNDNPSHIAFRSVGFVEGGTYPDYARINISMACNHCDNPVCLKGCPTRAYTKFAEYGAVLQDPDICFGCGYCTWVCPYNAPQLDPVKGQVSKCNMCVDRLEVGLKPACVSACLGNALDFGVIESTPDRRDQTKTRIPGFPTPDITHPNIRFQLSRTLQRVFVRPDGAPLKYLREGEQFRPVVDERKGPSQLQWNLKRLLTSHENAHIAFTLTSQAVMGAFLATLYATWFGDAASPIGTPLFLPLMILCVGLIGAGLVALNLHLGKPQFFYRGFNNWKLSPVSREIIGISAFFTGLAGYAVLGGLGSNLLGLVGDDTAQLLADLPALLAAAGAAVGLFYMIKLYLIPARPFWNHWQTASSFIGNGLALGALILAAATVWTYGLASLSERLPGLALMALAGLALEAVGLLFHARDMRQAGEGAASHFEQTSTFGYPYWLRNGLLAANLAALALLAQLGLPDGLAGAVAAGLLAASMLAAAIIGRALFYVLVIPTTMPGAFFWRNKSFERHAVETGLADRVRAGLIGHGH